MSDPLEQALAELALGPEVDPNDPAAVRAWLEQSGVPAPDASAIEAAGVGPLLVYRRLVRDNLREALRASMPRTLARLGGLFDEYFDGFLATRPPKTHHLRDVTPSFLDHCAPLFAADPRVPDWMIELGRHEALQIEVGALLARESHTTADLSLAGRLDFIEAVRLVRYEHAVHRLSEDETDRAAPERKPTALLVYRSPEHEVRYLELSPLAADILERLVGGTPLGESIRLACREAGVPVDSSLLDETARLLADLAERGVIRPLMDD